MRGYTPREFTKLLRENGYEKIRQCGSHAVYKNGTDSITITTRKLNPCISTRLIKEHNLKEKGD